MMSSVGTEKTDLVCGMDLEGIPDIVSSAYEGREVFFCSDYCRDRFLKEPSKFFGTPLIELEHVKKTFTLGKVLVDALRGLHLRVFKGDFAAVVGASGSGKSTALNIIGLLDEPTSGRVLLNGVNTAELDDDKRSALRSRTFGFVF